MEDGDFDFAILGGGSAGYAAARTAVDLGLKTVVIDGAKELGGLCILRGCMPSKTLIESANRALTIRRAAEFGLEAKLAAVDTTFIRQRKRRLIGEFADYRQKQLESGKFLLLRGTGRFERVRDDSIAIAIDSSASGGGTRVISARTVLIATGSVVSVPDVPGLPESGYWTSDTILDAAEIPESFVVLGGGAIALEMAHYLEGIGRKVTVLQRNAQLLKEIDADLAAVVRESLERRGIEVRCGTKLVRVEFDAARQEKVVYFEREGRTESARGAEILVALGRRAALAGLGLAEVGIGLQCSDRSDVKSTQQSSHPRVFAAGDACSPLEVVHLAIQQGEVAARNAAAILRGEPPSATMDYRCKLFGVFTEPQVASVGLSETEARARHPGCLVATYPFDDHGKSMVMGETEGFVKLIADPQNGGILGGAVVGPEAIELIHEISVAMHLRATVAQLATAPHYHPTLSEIWTYPAEELAETLKNKS